MKRFSYNSKDLKVILRHSFVLGAGSILSFAGNTTPIQQTKRPLAGYRSDAASIRGDWSRVGKQLMWATKSITK